MTSIPELKERLLAEYASAESRIKSCERHTLASPTAAVNQMRYAGRHLLDYLNLDESEKTEAARRECLEKAINHSRRASFDALETLIFSQLEFIADFQNICRTKRDVLSVYPDYVADYSSLSAMQERLQAFKMVQHLSKEEENDLFEISKKVSALKRKILGVKVSVDKLDSTEIADSVVLSVQQFLLSFTATVLGTVLGIVGVMFGVWGMLECAIWIKFSCMLLILSGFWLAWKRFYIWSARRLLTEEQRTLLSDRFHVKWR